MAGVVKKKEIAVAVLLAPEEKINVLILGDIPYALCSCHMHPWDAESFDVVMV